jgi:predicted nucleotidyltransferase component of viral defense system
MKDTIYFKQARLLLQTLPLVTQEAVFALKGGTAINFFIRDLPRLSVDIDLTYLPVNERAIALKEIQEALLRIAGRVERQISEVSITRKINQESRTVAGLLIRHDEATIKIEPNLVIRGSVFPTEMRSLCQRAQKFFELSVDARTLSFDELYGGKICAALDRQHPRDLFDIYMLLRNEGFSEGIRKAFIVYLVSHDRPISELLRPIWGDIRPIFEKEFQGMVLDPVTVSDLADTAERLVSWLRTEMTEDERRFILSVKKGKPEWNLLGLPGIENLPAVKWKLLNIGRMKLAKHQGAVQKLMDCLGIKGE